MAFNNTHTDILVAGAAAAFTIDLLVYPLDTIKTRMQSPDYARLYTNSSSRPSPALFRGLYQGVGSVILATVPSSGAFFTTYEASKSVLTRLNSDLLPPAYRIPTPALHSAASCAGELVSCLILTPAEVLKQNAQMVRRSGGARLFDGSATKHAVDQFRQKPARLFRGYVALVARNLPFTAMQFPVFEYAKVALLERRRATKYGGRPEETLLEKAAITATAAGGAGSVAAVLTTPVDVVKTRIMLAAAKDGDGASDAKAGEKVARSRLSGFRVAQEVMAESGIKGLFRGGLLRGAWTALGSGLYLSIYESARSYLENRRTGEDTKVFQG